LIQQDHGAFKRALWFDDRCAGAVRIQDPWLYGPYLALLAILPGSQGMGLGAAVLQWMESEVRGSSNNIWACVSSFNTEALRFYQRHGFETIGVIPDLLRPGFSEILIRKHLR
jgi:ribosomal protein S18 acetylase RimI-like enzyme